MTKSSDVIGFSFLISTLLSILMTLFLYETESFLIESFLGSSFLGTSSCFSTILLMVVTSFVSLEMVVVSNSLIAPDSSLDDLLNRKLYQCFILSFGLEDSLRI